MKHTKTQDNDTADDPQCDQCGEQFASMDELVDHVGDDHDAFTGLVTDYVEGDTR